MTLAAKDPEGLSYTDFLKDEEGQAREIAKYSGSFAMHSVEPTIEPVPETQPTTQPTESND